MDSQKITTQAARLVDRFGRVINYLRISVTDRCNMRCAYCMPESGIKLLPRKNILSYEEILKIVGVSAGLGINRFRITGGEPLLREGISGFISKAVRTASDRKCSPEECEFTLTTNGLLLEQMAEEVYDAGIRRLNVSLDTLKEERFFRITKRDGLRSVIDGIKKSSAIGFNPVKVNVVVMKGINENEIEDFINFALENRVVVRFIEQMPFGYFESPPAGKNIHEVTVAALPQRVFGRQDSNTLLTYVSLEKIEKEMVDKYHLALTPTPAAGPGRHYGYVGFIPARSRPFCRKCNRLRLTPDGKLRLCLGYPFEIDLQTPIRMGATEEDIEKLFIDAIKNKPEKHGFEKKMEKECMSQIGG